MPRKVFITDDQQRFLDEFQRKHQDHYEIVGHLGSTKLLDALSEAERLPDIVILDLYYPTDDTEPSFEVKAQAAEAELKKLDDQIAVTAKAVSEAWTPHGIELLKSIREKWKASELPIVIFTQKGLLLLDDTQIRAVEQLDGHWLLKGRLSRETEKIRLDRIMSYDTQNRGRSIFIGHGRSSEWKKLCSYLEGTLRLPWIEFNKESAAGRPTFEQLRQMANRSAFAFLIMTGDDERAGGALHARENVVHEIGFFQARLGEQRAIVLLEEGCQEFSNISGLNQIRFPKGNILSNEVTIDIQKVLKREHMIP